MFCNDEDEREDEVVSGDDSQAHEVKNSDLSRN
jgi:hypothetical protein